MGMLSNGLSGLNAAQIGLNVVSNNVANSNVAGYSRMEAISVARGSNGNSSMNTGQGVEVNSIRRITDDYLNNSLWRSNSSYGFNQSYSNYLSTTEQLVGNENISIAIGLDSLFNAFNSASAEPSSTAPRQQIIASADALVRRFNSLASNLDVQSTQINEQVDGMLDSANTLFAQVATLNDKIVEGTALGGNVSALQDQRAEAVHHLSELMDVNVTRQTDGSMTLSMAGGQPIVLGSNAAVLSDNGSDYQVKIAGQSFTFNGEIGGKMGGVLSYQTEVLDSTKQKLDQLAKDTADSINKQLAAGQDLHTPAGNGAPLFHYDPLDPAGSLQISAGFKPEDLALAAVGAGPGDNSNLTKLLDLKESQYDAYNALVGDLAIQSGQALADAKASQTIVKNALAQRNSVSGVNLDEEGISLLKYQQSYKANAKVISAADQLFATLLSMM